MRDKILLSNLIKDYNQEEDETLFEVDEVIVGEKDEVLESLSKSLDDYDLSKDLEQSSRYIKGNERVIGGWATTPDRDLVGEIINLKGMDIEPFLKDGFFNWEHLNKQNPLYIVGVPLQGEIKPQGFYTIGQLFKNHPIADGIWELAKTLKELKKSAGIDRKLGFSVQGITLERAGTDKSIINRSVVTQVAITSAPANPNARFDVFLKSLYASLKTRNILNKSIYQEGLDDGRNSLIPLLDELIEETVKESTKELVKAVLFKLEKNIERNEEFRKKVEPLLAKPDELYSLLSKSLGKAFDEYLKKTLEAGQGIVPVNAPAGVESPAVGGSALWGAPSTKKVIFQTIGELKEDFNRIKGQKDEKIKGAEIIYNKIRKVVDNANLDEETQKEVKEFLLNLLEFIFTRGLDSTLIVLSKVEKSLKEE